MANVGTAPQGKVLTAQGNTSSPTFNDIGTKSGLTQHGVLLAQGNSAFTATAVGATNTVLLGNTGLDPSFGQVPNGALVNSSVTLNSGNNITVSGGGPLALGGTASFNLTGTTNHAVQVGNGTGSLTSLAVGSTGQVLVGNTGADPSWGTLTSAFPWTDVSGAVNAAVNNGYFVTGTCTSTLPASPSQGDRIHYVVDVANPSLLTIQANTGQKIRIGTTLSSSAGTAQNTQQGDGIMLVYRSTGSTWFAQSNPTGGWNLT